MRRGFTLIELMMAIFILALSATVLMTTQNTSLRMMGYANNTAVVTMLTRAKMQDLEYEVQSEIADEGLTDNYYQEFSGDFGDMGYEDMEWEAVVQSTEIDDDAANNFVESVTNQLYGSGDTEGTLSGNTTITKFLPLMVSYLPNIINQLGKRIRKITLTTTWYYLGKKQTLTVSQFITILQVDDSNSGASVTSKEDEENLDAGTIGGKVGNSGSSRGSGNNGISRNPNNEWGGSRNSGGSGGSRNSGGSGGSRKSGGSGGSRKGGN